MSKRAKYTAVTVNVALNEEDDEADTDSDTKRHEDSSVGSEDDDDDEDFSDLGESLADEEKLNRQLDLEIEEILKLNTTLNAQERRNWCTRCFCGTRNARIISVWFFTFLIFGVVETIGSIKVRMLTYVHTSSLVTR